MSQNIHQLYLVNPATTMVSTDLMYLGRSPYLNDGTDDFAVPWSVIQQYIPFSVVNTVLLTSGTLVPQQVSIADNTGLVTLALPSTAAVGTFLMVVGFGSGGWKISQGAGQSMTLGVDTTTVGTTGYLAAANKNDCVTMICTAANTSWTVVASIGNITFN